METDDKSVILKIKKGEIDQFAVLVKKYAKTIQRYIYSKLFKKNDVDDLVQNTFISFYKAINRFDETKKILPYLYQIAKNELKMYYRSHKETVMLNDQIHLADNSLDYFKHDYSKLLDSLSGEQKKIFQLLIDGYSYQDIASKINKPINTIRTIIHRTRLQFKKHYNEFT